MVLKCNRIQNAEVSDTTGDAIKSEAGKKTKSLAVNIAVILR